MGSELMYNPLALKKAKTARDAFLQGFFFITIYLWKLLAITSRKMFNFKLIKKN